MKNQKVNLKTEFIRIRINKSEKQSIERVCKMTGKIKSQIIRDAIVLYVNGMCPDCIK